jgi:hypothetical protein
MYTALLAAYTVKAAVAPVYTVIVFSILGFSSNISFP